MRRIPSRYLGDMCCSPSTSLPACRRWRTCSSVSGASSSAACATTRCPFADVTLDLRPLAYSLPTVRSSEATAGVIEVVNPATEEVVDTVPAGSREEVELAVATAKRAFPEWSRTDVEKRAEILARAAELIHEHARDVAAT